MYRERRCRHCGSKKHDNESRRDTFNSDSMFMFEEPFEEKVERYERKCRYLIWGR